MNVEELLELPLDVYDVVCAEPEAWPSERMCEGSDVSGLDWFWCTCGRVGVEVVWLDGPARGGAMFPVEAMEMFDLLSSNSGRR